MHKYYWWPLVAMVVSGCALQAPQPGQKVSGVYAYEVAPHRQTPASHQKTPAASGSGDKPAAAVSAASASAGASAPVTAKPRAGTEKQTQKNAAAQIQPAAEQQQKTRAVNAPSPASGLSLAAEASPTPEPGAAVPVSAMDIQPGQCWVYAQVQPRPVQENIEVTVRDSEVKLEVTPAEFRRGIKQVVTKEGTKTYRVIPPTYKEVTERVLVRPETKRLVVEPAVYEEVEEEVVLEEARTELRPCRTSGAAAYAGTTSAVGFCAVEIPARTEKVKVTRLVKPETTREEVIPAEYKTITRRVVDKPAQVIPVTTDDEINTLEVSELVAPPQARKVEIPAETVSVNVQKYEGKPRIVARQAVCDRDLTRDMVRELQEKLAALGYEPGELDGLPGPNTMSALSAYQVDHGLASGAITIETMEHLGLLD